MAARSDFSIENAKIKFHNFAGKERKFNPAGKRVITLDLAEQLSPVIRHSLKTWFLTPRRDIRAQSAPPLIVRKETVV